MFQFKSARGLHLSFGTLAVLLAVFGWGIHYKTALYHQQAPKRSAPPAKILSEAERTDTSQATVLSRIHAPVFQHASSGILSALFALKAPRTESLRASCLRQALAELRPRTSSHLRGPPRQS